MEIVINRCFGGFSLSRKALEELSNKGIQTFKDWESLKQKTEGAWIILSDNEYYSNYNCYRTDKDLIDVVKLLGKEANGSCANLEIVDIPDDISYEIDNYDGSESIHETHRSW